MSTNTPTEMAAQQEAERQRAYVEQHHIDEAAHRAYGGSLTIMGILLVVAWAAGCLAAGFVAWWAIFAPIVIHVGVRIHAVLCDISVQLRKRDR